MLEFGALPPEINSAWMYTGPGSAPMMAAAAAWQALAAELGSTAAAYQTVIARLAGEQWMGPASASMAAAAAPYVAWMNATAAQAAQAATQATAAAAAFETAFAMTVPPPMIAANRSLLMTLVATNFLGQNTPAIAATEAHYGQMWAQDATAMYGYAGASAVAARLTPFSEPAQTTNPAGPGVQAAGNTEMAQLISTMPAALQNLASPVESGSSSASGLPGILTGLLGSGNLSSSVDGMVNAGAWNAASTLSTALGFLSNMGSSGGAAIGPAAALASTGSTGVTGLGALGGGAVSASFGQAGSVGMLSVPASWAAATPVSTAGAAALPGAAGNAAAASGIAGMPAGVPMGGFGARAGGANLPHYGFRPTVVPHPVLAG